MEEKTFAQAKCTLVAATAAVLLSCVYSAAWAHEGHGTGAGFLAAAMHPLTGLDHLLAALAAGLLASRLDARARVRIPIAYALGLLAGAVVLAWGWMPSPFEAVLGFSVVALGFLVAAPARWLHAMAPSIVALFAAFHGHAHQFASVRPTTVSFEVVGLILVSVALVVLATASGCASVNRFGPQIARAGIPLMAAGTVLTVLATG